MQREIKFRAYVLSEQKVFWCYPGQHEPWGAKTIRVLGNIIPKLAADP